MKLTQMQAFEKHLKGAEPNHFSPLYLIMGKEAFLRTEAVKKLVAALKKSIGMDFEMQTLEGDGLSTKALMDELNALNLFAKKRAIIVESVDGFSKDLMTSLIAYFDKPNDTIYLILSTTAVNTSTNFYKKCEKVGIVVEFPEEKSWEKEKIAQEWIAAVIAKEQMTVETGCCQQIVKQLGTDKEQLYCEIQKLVCYVGERRHITSHDIAAIVTSAPIDNGWQFSEAILRREAQEALRISKNLLTDNTPIFLLLRQLRSQFQTQYQICTILCHGGGAAEVTSQYPYMKGSILERNIALARGYGLQNFKRGLLKIDETELQAKNSALEASFLLELLVIKLTSALYK